MLKKNRKNKVSSKLKLVKILLYNILENESSPYNQIYNIIAIFLVLTSSIGILLDFSIGIKSIPPDLKNILDDYEEFTLIFFTVEYLLRLWVISDFKDDFEDSFVENSDLPFIKRVLIAFKDAITPKLKWMKTNMP